MLVATVSLHELNQAELEDLLQYLEAQEVFLLIQHLPQNPDVEFFNMIIQVQMSIKKLIFSFFFF